MSFGSIYVAETDSNLIQEAMLRLHVYAKSEVVVNEEAFLRRAIHNLAIDHYRRNRLVAGREVQIENADRQHPLIAPEPTPDRVLESQQCLDQLAAILDAVSRRTREVYLAHRFGYSYAEIAADMGIAKITIKRHIARAHLIIAKHVDVELPEHRFESRKPPLNKAPQAGGARYIGYCATAAFRL
jgi:RNA polymerase sigma factor (sigma-70 family)